MTNDVDEDSRTEDTPVVSENGQGLKAAASFGMRRSTLLLL